MEEEIERERGNRRDRQTYRETQRHRENTDRKKGENSPVSATNKDELVRKMGKNYNAGEVLNSLHKSD